MPPTPSGYAPDSQQNNNQVHSEGEFVSTMSQTQQLALHTTLLHDVASYKFLSFLL